MMNCPVKGGRAIALSGIDVRTRFEQLSDCDGVFGFNGLNELRIGGRRKTANHKDAKAQRNAANNDLRHRFNRPVLSPMRSLLIPKLSSSVRCKFGIKRDRIGDST